MFTGVITYLFWSKTNAHFSVRFHEFLYVCKKMLYSTRLKKVLGVSLAGLFLLFNIENQIICGGMILMTHCVCGEVALYRT